MSTAKDQVTRMLALVPYLRGHGGIPVEQVAREFGVPRRQIVKDLNVLWFCGLPEAVTGEMIDVDMEALEVEGVVYIDNAEFLSRPVRLTPHEAVSLIVALRTLRSSAQDAERTAIESTLAKLESAAGDGAVASSAVEVHVEEVDTGIHEVLTRALKAGKRLHLGYLVASRDEQTERDVDPLRLITAQGRIYLEAWCYRAEDLRLFRLDRIVSAAMLDEDVAEHDDASRRDLSAGLFQPTLDGPAAVLDLLPNARWITDYYPVERVELGDGDTARVTIRANDEEWLVRFVLRQGGNVKVVAPASLAETVGKRARVALAAYDESDVLDEEETL